MLTSTKLAFEKCRAGLAPDARADLDRLSAKLTAAVARTERAFSLAVFTKSLMTPGLTGDDCEVLTFYAATEFLVELNPHVKSELEAGFNLQYLQLQMAMQSESRAFTAISNIMKTKHDTVKNSISNVR